MLSTDGGPVFANTSNFPDFVGVYEKDATSAQVIDIIKQREKLRTSAALAIKGGGGGGGGGVVSPRPPSTGPGPIE